MVSETWQNTYTLDIIPTYDRTGDTKLMELVIAAIADNTMCGCWSVASWQEDPTIRKIDRAARKEPSQLTVKTVADTN